MFCGGQRKINNTEIICDNSNRARGGEKNGKRGGVGWGRGDDVNTASESSRELWPRLALSLKLEIGFYAFWNNPHLLFTSISVVGSALGSFLPLYFIPGLTSHFILQCFIFIFHRLAFQIFSVWHFCFICQCLLIERFLFRSVMFQLLVFCLIQSYFSWVFLPHTILHINVFFVYIY